MATTSITICIDENLKKQAEILFHELGMTMTTAFTIFIKEAIRQQKIPFEVALDVPNAETLAAIDDVNCERNLSKSFHSVTELMGDLNA